MQIISKGAEAKLVETLGELGDRASGYNVIAFAFSELLEEYRSDYQIKIALNMLNDLLKDEDASVFLCQDKTLFLLCNGTSKQQVDKVIFQLRYLFMDDPLAYTPDGEENEAFCRRYDLSVDLDTILKAARTRMLGRKPAAGPAGPAPSAAKPAGSSGAVAPPPPKASAASGGAGVKGKFFNASSLAVIERDLANADVSMVMRRQPVCAAIPDMMVRRVFDELYINIAHLRQMMRVDADLLSNRWLFKYLTELLDQRMLHMIQKNPVRFLESPVSMNLNIRTLLSDAFQEFDTSVKPSIKVSIVIEIQISDVFEDMRAFHVARESVQKMGYRICLDGLTNLSFSMIDRERLGFDLVKLQWNADIPADLQTAENRLIAEAVKRCGPNRIILTRCDNRKAVDYGQTLGVSLFQGRYLDKLMNPMSKVEN